MKMKRVVILMFTIAQIGSCANNADTRPPKMVLVEYNIASNPLFVDTVRINVNEIENYDSLDQTDQLDALMDYLGKKHNDRITRLKIWNKK